MLSRLSLISKVDKITYFKQQNSANNGGFDMTRINIEIDDELHKKAKLSALLKNVTLIQYIHEALEEKVKKDGKR